MDFDAVFNGVTDKSTITKVVLESGTFTADHWEWWATNAPDFSGLVELEMKPTMAGVSVGASSLELPALRKVSIAKLSTVPPLFARYGSKLEEVSFPDAELLEEYAFSDLSAVSKFSLPKVSRMKRQAFWNCGAMRILQLGETPPIAEEGDLYLDEAAAIHSEARLEIVGLDGMPLQGESLATARQRYRAVNDGNTKDQRWWAWSLLDQVILFKVSTSIKPLNSTDATVQLSQTRAEEGATIMVKALPAHGKMITGIRVFKTGEESTAVEFDQARKSFVQPGYPVTVEVEAANNVMAVEFHHDAIELPGNQTFPAGKIEKVGTSLEKILKDKETLAPGSTVVRNHIKKIVIKSGAFLSHDY